MTGCIRLAAALAVALLLAAPSGSAAGTDWAKAQTVAVGMAEYAFTPNRLSFRRGVAYRLRLVNHGKEIHEFGAPEFFRAVAIANPKILNPDRTEIDVAPGQHKDLLFVAKTPGTYKLACPDHDWAGMTGDISIR